MATGIGETLVAARRQQGVALSDAAAETRVRESYLAALEEEDFAALGGDVYVKGFLRSYARFLRLDPEPLIAEYRTQYERPDDFTGLAQHPVAPLPTERSPALVVGIGVAVIAVMVLAAIGLLNDRDEPQDTEVAPAPVETATQPLPTQRPTTTAEKATEPDLSDDPTEVLAGDAVRMVLNVNGGTSWVRIVVDGATELEGEQPDGTRLRYRADESIVIRVGDPGVVSLRVNGQRVGSVGDPGIPVTKTFTVDEGA
ncbi:MAG: DUF4115 domain-containing protein [Nitriliruptorales bacterium]|nr:DUF4115 domain-containing protein [Nitriliruptorales bacterium]